MNLEFTYAKKVMQKNGPIVQKIRFAKVAKMAIFRNIAKGLIRQKCEKMDQFLGQLKNSQKSTSLAYIMQ